MADLIERFLEGRLAYPREWNDFVDCSQQSSEMDGYRSTCYELDPFVNCPDPQDKESLDELRRLVDTLRNYPLKRRE